MSATKLILKRSSVLGKRPGNQVIEPGELALNTNADEPGLFFEVTDGNVVKVGPTAVSPFAPVNLPEKGEAWLSTANGTLNIGTVEEAKKVWRAVASPYLGGGGRVVFVAPEFPLSSDSLLNDGQALPYQTLNRAALEITKLRLSDILAGNNPASENNRYVIYCAPSRTTVVNSPGVSVDAFNVDFSTNPEKTVTFSDLAQFNGEDGGLVIPGGISILGMDLKKSELKPIYVPTYANPAYPVELAGENQPLSAIMRVAGNTYCKEFSVTDKVNLRYVVRVGAESAADGAPAVFDSDRPHGLNYNDEVTVGYPGNVDQTTGTLQPGNYYVAPIDSFSFYLAPGSLVGVNPPAYVSFGELPLFTSENLIKLVVSNTLKSAHRLDAAQFASLSDLSAYYTKVQKAFASFFGGRVTPGATLVSQEEYVIVASTAAAYPNNTATNSTRNSSAYFSSVNVRSNYGMCFGDFDGGTVEGFRSVIANECTVVSLQEDPAAYEIFTTVNDQEKWWPLTQATYFNIPLEQRPASIVDTPVEAQLKKLNETPVSKIRYYFETLKTQSGESTGLTDTNNDFRHYGFRIRNNAYGQLQSTYTIGTAIGSWAFNGGLIHLTNSTSNFGSIAFKSEGFSGINTIGGANPNSKGYLFEGIQRPLALTLSQAENNENKTILSLGGRVISVDEDKDDTGIHLIQLSADFSPNYLLPFSLKPGSAIWIDSGECTYRGFLAVDGGPTVITGQNDPANFAVLRIRSSDSTIPLDPALLPSLGIPYIRRFRDPRRDADRSYSFVISNTNTSNAVSPQPGSVLRLNQTSQTQGVNTLRPNVQFDPGQLGGWGRVFTVDEVMPATLGDSPQFNYVVGDITQDITYHVTLTVSDYARPWTQELLNSAGSYVTYNNQNWYAAENDIWQSVYYNTSFGDGVGPMKIAPGKSFSPFVVTSSLEKQELVESTYQGTYGVDPYRDQYLDGTYFRGATVPYTAFSSQNPFDDDDGSLSTGVCLKDIATGETTQIVTPINTLEQSQIQAQTFPTATSLYRPAIVQFSVLGASAIPNPKQIPVIITLSTAGGKNVEYMRVINLNGSLIQAIRLNPYNSLYPAPPGWEYANPEASVAPVWPIGSTLTVCVTNPTPSPYAYDPDWSNTKRAVFRFFEVMGYNPDQLEGSLTPKYWGERFLPVDQLELSPSETGYATVTGKWPLEFNQPSTVWSNTHTWAFTGQFSYSRGLPYFQPSDIPRKLSSDFQATTLWSGRVVITGVNDKGEIVLFGPQREALTAQYFEPIAPSYNLTNQQIYETQPFVEFPNQVVVYSADNISGQFNGQRTEFNLTRGSLSIPADQLSANSTVVLLGGAEQIPGENYAIVNNQLTFATAPPEGATCNIRVVTSEDNEQTLVVVPLTLKGSQTFDGVQFQFDFESADLSIDLKYLDINNNNVFLFLGGVQQIPNLQGLPNAYSVEKVDASTVRITFTEAPAAGLSYNVRAICSADYWASRSIYPVEVYCLNDISGFFDGARMVFDLTYGAGNLPVNPATINTQNLFVAVGGSMQLPSIDYSVSGSTITFSTPPTAGLTSNLRVVTNAEFLTCPQSNIYRGSFLNWGPSIVIKIATELGLN
jgi:hypothetical protein